MSKDNFYAQPLGDPVAFRFDEDVAKVFPDMIERSVPGYSTIIAMTGLMAGRYARGDTCCYDLGCSLGASTLSMRRHVRARGCRIVGIDNSEAMLERCQEAIDASHRPSVELPRRESLDSEHMTNNTDRQPSVELRCEDILQTSLENASVVVLNFTLQFLPLEDRDTFIQRIADALVPGGILVLSEKVRFSEPDLDALNIDLHHQFKRANGYSELEVAQKRDALENVLLPETLETHRARITAAGFKSCDVWFQCFNFASLVALK